MKDEIKGLLVMIGYVCTFAYVVGTVVLEAMR
jgi:hypothetical protein